MISQTTFDGLGLLRSLLIGVLLLCLGFFSGATLIMYQMLTV